MIWHSLKVCADSGEELSKARRQNIDAIILKLQAIGEQQVISISAYRLTMAVAGGIVVARLNAVDFWVDILEDKKSLWRGLDRFFCAETELVQSLADAQMLYRRQHVCGLGGCISRHTGPWILASWGGKGSRTRRHKLEGVDSCSIGFGVSCWRPTRVESDIEQIMWPHWLP